MLLSYDELHKINIPFLQQFVISFVDQIILTLEYASDRVKFDTL